MSKAPAFLFYAGDFLSSPDVQAMDTREVGAYTLLLLNAWQGDLPGHLPNNEDRLRRLCRMSVAEWEVSRELLLSKFPVADMGHTRYNPRLVAEAEKQETRRLQQQQNGKRGGRPKKPNESQKNPSLSEGNPTLSETKPNANPTESFSISISSSPDGLQDAGEPAPRPAPALVAEKGGQRLRTHDDAPLFDPAKWPGLADPARFAAICKQVGYAQVDFELYRLQILAKLDGEQMPASTLRNFIQGYLNTHRRDGKLLLAPVQAPNERPSNYHGNEPYKPPTGGRIPDMSSIMNPNWKPPQA